MACEQAEQGADFLDINVGMGGIDEKEAMLGAIQEVIRAVDVPPDRHKQSDVSWRRP